MLRRKIKQGKGNKGRIKNNNNHVSKKGLIEKVTFEQRRQGGEEVSQMVLWGKSILARGNSQGRGLEPGACLARCRNSEGAGEAGVAGGE